MAGKSLISLSDEEPNKRVADQNSLDVEYCIGCCHR